MKALIASLFALTLLGATAASAQGIGAGVQVGNVGVGLHVGGGHRHCVAWGRNRHHDRYCRRWSR